MIILFTLYIYIYFLNVLIHVFIFCQKFKAIGIISVFLFRKIKLSWGKVPWTALIILLALWRKFLNIILHCLLLSLFSRDIKFLLFSLIWKELRSHRFFSNVINRNNSIIVGFYNKLFRLHVCKKATFSGICYFSLRKWRNRFLLSMLLIVWTLWT